MPLILGAQSAVATGFAVDNSCRFNAADNTYMHRTQTAGDQKTWTLSYWVKRSDVDAQQCCVSIEDGAAYVLWKFNTSEFFEWRGETGAARFITDAKYQDPTAWFHVVTKCDTTESVEANRFKIWINGTQVTSFGTETYPALNSDTYVNKSGGVLRIGTDEVLTSDYSGYLAEVVLTDGTAYDASSFGEFDEDSPTIWKPIDVSGLSFGTNGFYLDFEDSSDFGSDVSGQGNDLTDVNLAAADQGTDTPTNNFCTMNPLENFLPAATFSEGNNTVLSNSGAVYAPNLSTIGVTAGKWYWEVKPTTGSTDYMIGVSGTQTTAAGYELGHNPNDYGYAGASGIVRSNDANVAYGDTYTTNDIMGVALDLTNNKLYWAKNSVWQNSGVPTSGATGTGAISITAVGSIGLGAYFPAVTYWTSSAGTFALNFGGCSAFDVTSGNADGNGYGNFEYEPPSGYLAICTKNLGSDGG